MYKSLAAIFSRPESRIQQGLFRPYRVTFARIFLMRSAQENFSLLYKMGQVAFFLLPKVHFVFHLSFHYQEPHKANISR